MEVKINAKVKKVDVGEEKATVKIRLPTWLIRETEILSMQGKDRISVEMDGVTVTGKFKKVTIGEEDAIIPLKIDTEAIKHTNILDIIGKEDIAIIFNDNQTTLDDHIEKEGEE